MTLVVGDDEEAIRKAAALTVRYSDAPRGEPVWVKVSSTDSEDRIQAEAANDDTLKSLRIKGAKIRVKKTGG